MRSQSLGWRSVPHRSLGVRPESLNSHWIVAVTGSPAEKENWHCYHSYKAEGGRGLAAAGDVLAFAGGPLAITGTATMGAGEATAVDMPAAAAADKPAAAAAEGIVAAASTVWQGLACR